MLIDLMCRYLGTSTGRSVSQLQRLKVWPSPRFLPAHNVTASERPSLRAGISCLGLACAAPRFNQALGSEIWAWRAGCTQAPFIWFQSSLRPRMWPRGHSFSRHWGGGWEEVVLSSTKGRHICLEECVCVQTGLTNFGYFGKAATFKMLL